ncbi:MAG: hypothetical protein A2X86_13960 [Bdellovibrionales bacterium GWA2_49_15]|nr:MAG: hypothetical protein A2X86_13960 [Bdellovibrionales bacterium GWA2_49_15]
MSIDSEASSNQIFPCAKSIHTLIDAFCSDKSLRQIVAHLMIYFQNQRITYEEKPGSIIIRFYTKFDFPDVFYRGKCEQ